MKHKLNRVYDQGKRNSIQPSATFQIDSLRPRQSGVMGLLTAIGVVFMWAVGIQGGLNFIVLSVIGGVFLSIIMYFWRRKVRLKLLSIFNESKK